MDRSIETLFAVRDVVCSLKYPEAVHQVRVSTAPSACHTSSRKSPSFLSALTLCSLLGLATPHLSSMAVACLVAAAEATVTGKGVAA